MKNIILRAILVLFVLSSCIAVSVISTCKRLNKPKLTNNIESPYHGSCHGPYEYMTKDGDSKIIAVDYILKNGNYKELDLILHNNIRNCVINFNSKELSILGNGTDSLLHIVRNTLSKFDTVITYQITISNWWNVQ